MEISTNVSGENLRSSPLSPIVKFYEGKSIFITGVTGFLGTVLIEKLLFSCKNLKNIYVLIRQKHGTSIAQRLEAMLESEAFHRIREHQPDAVKKIIPIGGNLVEKNLGITENDIRLLQKDVSIVFHMAANISLGMGLSDAININTKSTEKLISICKNMRQLTALVYVSSAYSNCNQSIVDEKMYKTAVPLEVVRELLEFKNSINIVSKILPEGRPNIYSYSKALSEEIVAKCCPDLPAIIVRPTIILAAVKEPIPGWLRSWAGPTGIVEGASRGMWPFWHSIPDNVLDMVPVDYVANFLIAAAWDTHNRRVKGDIQKCQKIKVFNYSSCVQNPIDTGNFIRICLRQLKKRFQNDSIFTSQILIFIENHIVFSIVFTIYQTILTIILFILDAFLFFTGRERRMIKLQKDLYKLTSFIEFFTRHKFLFLDGNVRRLQKSLNETDRELFDFNMSNLDWESYLGDYVVGMRNYLLNK